MNRRTSSLFFALALALAACGGDDGGGDPGDDPDAAVVLPDADPASFCEIVEFSHGALGMLAGTGTLIPIDDLDPTGPQQVTLQMDVNSDAVPDTMFLELYEGEPPFDTGVVTGTYTIIDAQTDLIACSVCAYLAGDFVQGENINFHMASSGAVSITTADIRDGGSIAGSMENLTLREVTVSQQGQMTVVNGCETTIESLSFDLTLTAN